MSLVPYRPALALPARQIPRDGGTSTEIAVFGSARADGKQDVRDADACLASAELSPRMTATRTPRLAEPRQHAIDCAEGRAVLQYAAERERDGNAGRHGIQMKFFDQRGYGESEQQIGDAVAATVITITGLADKRRGHVA